MNFNKYIFLFGRMEEWKDRTIEGWNICQSHPFIPVFPIILSEKNSMRVIQAHLLRADSLIFED